MTGSANDTAMQDAMRNFYLKTQRAVDRLCTAHGISSARARLMGYIAVQGSARSTDLVQTFGFAPRTITEAIDVLEADGLVDRVPDPADRRVKRITLTAAGQKLLDTLIPAKQRLSDELFVVLSPEERSQLTVLLEKLTRRLQEIEEINGDASAAGEAGGHGCC